MLAEGTGEVVVDAGGGGAIVFEWQIENKISSTSVGLNAVLPQFYPQLDQGKLLVERF